MPKQNKQPPLLQVRDIRDGDRDDRDETPVEFTETPKGYRARDRWARRYEELDGAPESDYDR